MINQYLTEEQREHWNEEGYLVLKQVLSPEEIRTLLNAVDPVVEDYVQEEFGGDAPRAFTIIRAIERTDALDILTDHANIFGTIRIFPARSHASIIRSQSESVNAIGFSTNTCFPASAAATTWSPCRL